MHGSVLTFSINLIIVGRVLCALGTILLLANHVGKK